MRDARPHVQARLGRVDVQADAAQRLQHAVPAPLVDGVPLVDRVQRVLQGLDAHVLDRLGHARIEVRLYHHQRVDHLGVARRDAETPAGHVVALGQRVKLHAHFHRARRLQEAGGLVAVERDLGVGGVVQHGYVVPRRELHHLLEVVGLGYRPGGVVRVVEPHHLCGPRHVLRYGLQVGQPAVLLQQRHPVALAAREPGAHRVDGIAGIGHERYVARVQEAQRGVAYALLRADERQHLLVGVERDAEAPLVPVGGRLPELGQAVGLGVAVVGRVQGRLPQPFDDVGRRRYVRVAYAEADDLDTLLLLRGDLAADLDEQVRRYLV